MSLLITKTDERDIYIAGKIFDLQLENDGKLENEYDERRKRLMLEDIGYNLEYLRLSVKFESQTLFTNYIQWLFGLLLNRLSEISIERVREHMTGHFEAMQQVIACEYPSGTLRRKLI
jgi:hypothetical protein